MYVEMNPAKRPKGKSVRDWQREIGAMIDGDFPANGKVVNVRSSDETEILFLSILGKFDTSQFEWLNGSGLIDAWSYGFGGIVAVPDQQVALTFPCEWHIEANGINVKLTTYYDDASYLRINDGAGRRFTDGQDAALYAYLDANNIPHTGWTQIILLCERCDEPGASPAYPRCPKCEKEHLDFMRTYETTWQATVAS